MQYRLSVAQTCSELPRWLGITLASKVVFLNEVFNSFYTLLLRINSDDREKIPDYRMEPKTVFGKSWQGTE